MSHPKSSQAAEEFDYASLNHQTSNFVREQTAELKYLIKRSVEDIILIGKKLSDVKERLGHGKFTSWLKTEFTWSEDTALNFMHVAEYFGDNPKISGFHPSALYVLATKSTPEAARHEAFKRAEAGEKITHGIAKAIKQKYTDSTEKQDSNEKQDSKFMPEAASSQQLASTQFLEEDLSPPSPPTSSLQETSRSQPQEIVLTISNQEQVLEQDSLQPTKPNLSLIVTDEMPDIGSWWKLRTDENYHLLYCGNLSEPNFLKKITKPVSLLMGFPILLNAKMQFPLLANSYYSTILRYPNQDLLEKRAIKNAYELLEQCILSNSNPGDTVVVCFVPSPEILNVISCSGRRGILAEPDRKRCSQLINNWKDKPTEAYEFEWD